MGDRRAHARRWSIVAIVLALCAPIAPAVAPVALAVAPTPVASWNFNESSGTTAHDGVGHLDGTLSGAATWTASSPHEGSHALSLTHSTSKVAINSSATLQPASSLSLSLWVRTTEDGGGTLLEKGDAGCDPGAWRLSTWGGQVIFTWRAIGGNVASAYSTPSGAINDGNWHHVAVRMAINSGTTWVLVDGRAGTPGFAGADGIDYAAAAQTDTHLIVGSTNTCGDPSDTPTAQIDDLQFFDTLLSFEDFWAMEPSYATTTTVAVWPSPPNAGGTISFSTQIHPLVPTDAVVVFHWTRDGGVEQTMGASMHEDGSGSWTWYPPGLPTGHYVLTAVFSGLGPAQASSSDPLEFDIVPYATTTAMSGPNLSPLPGESFTLNPSTTYVVPQPGGTPGGPFTLYDVTGPTPVEVSTSGGCSDLSANGACVGKLTVPGLAIGTYLFRAHFGGSDSVAPSDSPDVQVVISKASASVSISAVPNPVQAHHGTQIQASVYTGINGSNEGTLEIRDHATNALLGSVQAPNLGIILDLPPMSVGSHVIDAVWSGNSQYSSGVAQVTVQVIPDVVEATGVGLSTTTFYPVVDGYKDTVLARGTRNEPISVAVTVKNSAGSTVRTGAISRATGTYSWSWNGKNTAGTLLPAGTYRIYQVLKDAAGTTKTVTTSVTLSRKKLYWYTTDLYKTAAQYQKKTSSWGAWLFTMPSATAYRSLRLYVDGSEGMFTGSYGAQDTRYCTWGSISPSCTSHAGSLPFSLSWVSIPLSATYDHSGRYVRAYVWAEYGSISVAKLRLHLQYGILK